MLTVILYDDGIFNHKSFHNEKWWYWKIGLDINRIGFFSLECNKHSQKKDVIISNKSLYISDEKH